MRSRDTLYTVLIVEDKESMAAMLANVFEAEGFGVRTAASVQDGLARLSAERISVVVTDLKLGDGDGMTLVSEIRQSFPFIPVVVMTAYGSIERAVAAIKQGAYDFIAKPFDPDHLVVLVKRALSEKGVQKENLVLKGELTNRVQLPDAVGRSAVWQEVLGKVRKVAPLKTTVLLLGESGTGKELVARSIHRLSPRAEEAFVAVNCAAIPKDLIENELFGHEKGAFTGAAEMKPGRFELADRGTIFLDEIGDMELPLQAKLLRVLQESEVERVGGTRTIKVDLRIVAASNKDLEREVGAGRFREDLFYRLNVFPVLIPPLRERRDDIIPLACSFAAYFSGEMRKETPSLSPEVERMLLGHEWKGNVRELRNIMERAVILCDGPQLLPEHLSFTVAGKESASCGGAAPELTLHEIAQRAVHDAERSRIEQALRQTQGNKSRAAELLKVSYKTLLTKIKEYRIS
ncbi:MAG: sigma-54 dependent transcriptional regulator [Nitrospirota bacterium]